MKKLILAIAAVFCAVAAAQNHGTGAYNHATLDNRGFDQVNVGNLNVRFSIPLISKAGRGLPFNYALQYEGLIWAPVAANGTTTWVPDPNWGFTGTLNGNGFLGYMTYTSVGYVCASWTPPNAPYPQYIYTTQQYGYVYHDPFGGVHSFNYSSTAACASGPWGPGFPASTYGDGSSSDGSGYKLGSRGYGVQTKNGVTIYPASVVNGGSSSNTGTESDANGNQISFNGSGTFTDTTGTNELTISGSNPVQFTYPVTLQANSATSASANLYYRSYTVRTNFGCSGIAEYGSNTEALVDHVTLADGETYSFGYEGTPGATDGAVTGRLASVTLPTGGTIQYHFTGGCGSGNGSGILGDGSAGPLTRTTSDGSRTYDRVNFYANGNSTVIYDEQGNQTEYWFTVDSLGQYIETHRQVYQGAVGGSTPLQEVFTCYNTSNQSCDGAAITEPVTSMNVTSSFNGKGQSLSAYSYDASGNFLTQSKVYSDAGNTLLTSTTNTYTASSSSVTELTSTQMTDSAGHSVSYTSYGYDETSPTATSGLPQHSTPSASPGNQTSVHVSIDGSTTNTLNTSTAYYDTGMPKSSAAIGGFTTNYGYDSTGTFQTSTTLPTPSSGVGLSTSVSYDVASGAALSGTGMNSGQTFSVTQYDALLRPTAATTPEGGQSTTTYAPNQISAKRLIDTRWSDTETYLDGYGRTIRTAIQSSSGWYLTDSCYVNGMLQAQSVPYLSSSANPSSTNCSSTNAKLYSYDALGRTTQVASPDTDTVTKTYQGRAVQVADNNGPTRISQYDPLGRLTGVCELNSNSNLPGNYAQDQNTTCPFDIQTTGLLTTYAYNLAAHSTTITQGVQQRVFTTDAAGRTTSVYEPESLTTSYAYAYNGTGLQVTRNRPKANQPAYPPSTIVYTNTTTQYDSIGRVVSIAYTNAADGSQDPYTPNKYFSYDQTGNGGSIANAGSSKGQLTMMNNGIHGRSFAYDIMGRVKETVECLPGYCNGQPSHDVFRWYGYDLASELTSETYGFLGNAQYVQNSTAIIGYQYNVAGQLTNMTGGQNNGFPGGSLYSATQSSMLPGGPQLVAYGNGLADDYRYDAVNRPNGQWLCSQPGGFNCPSETYYYGNAQSQVGHRMNWVVDTALNRWTQFSYDSMGNLAGSSVMPNSGYQALNLSATYDRYGNRWSETVTGTPSGVGPNQTLQYNTYNNQILYWDYDQAGNIMRDPSHTHTYTYDAENNLVQIDGGSTASFAYDALNERVQANENGVNQEYGVDLQGRRSTVWTNGSTTISQVQYYAGNQGLAYWSNTDNGIHFQHKDLIGSERLRTTANGSVEGTYTNLPFGEPSTSSGNDLNPSHFAGLELDGTSGLELHHAMFREYNALQGAWMSPDPYSGSYKPANPQSFNRYRYASNNPLTFVDPSGMDEMDELGDQGIIPIDGGGEDAGGGGDDGSGRICLTCGNNPPPPPPPDDPNDPCHGDPTGCNPPSPPPAPIDPCSVFECLGFLPPAPIPTLPPIAPSTFMLAIPKGSQKVSCSGSSTAIPYLLGPGNYCAYTCNAVSGNSTFVAKADQQYIRDACPPARHGCPVSVDMWVPPANPFGITMGEPRVVANSCIYGRVQ